MYVRYASSRLAKQCSSINTMRREWGNDVAKALARRIKDMQGAQGPEELLRLPGRWEWLKGVRSHQMSARLTPNWRLICEPEVDDDIVVVEVEDYH